MQAFIFRTVSRLQPRRFVQCATVGSFRAHWQETLYNMFTFTCLFLLPLLIMVLCYSRILTAISGRMKDTRGESTGRGHSIPPPLLHRCLVFLFLFHLPMLLLGSSPQLGSPLPRSLIHRS